MEKPCDKVSKGLWRAIKEITIENKPKQKTAKNSKLFYKYFVAEKEKNELFKQLIKDTIKNHKTESSKITKKKLNSLAFWLQQKNWMKPQKGGEKHAPGWKIFATNSLNNYLRMMKPFTVSSYLAP